jgi:pyruvate formate lyase activating enzyme
MEAEYFAPKGGGAIACRLCPHGCLIQPGRAGLCGVRRNKGGKPALPYYGYITALAMDPIEKKPLYHWRPGSEILSLGFAGCNLRCPFCQNWHISQNLAAPGEKLGPQDIVKLAAREQCKQTAYTYSEPLIHIEFLLDCMKACHEAGVANVLVSNGCVNEEPAAEIIPLVDAANIDLKCFDKAAYSETLGGDLETVKAFIKQAIAGGVHMELTTLIVPGFNDTQAELDEAADWIASLKPQPVWHLSAYHPAWKYRAPPTDRETLINIVKRAKEKVEFVYAGNI